MKMQLRFSIFLFVLSYNYVQTQNPSYFVLGESTLKNKDIYSVHQTKKNKLYVATNQGLYEYKNYKMQVIENAEEQRGTAVFNLVSNSRGDVFCSNLNGQIFKIVQDKLVLIHKLRLRDIGSNVRILIDDSDRIIIISKNISALHYNSKLEQWESILIHDFFEDKIRFKGYKNNNDIYLYSFQVDSMLRIKKSKLEKETLPLINRQKPYQLEQLIPVKDQLFSTTYLDSILKPVYSKEIVQHTYRNFNQNTWRRSNTSGLNSIDLKDDQPFIKHDYFKNLFVSTIFENDNGVLFLGTFGKGLYVVPSKSTLVYPIDYNSNFQSIEISADGTTYISDRSKGIIAITEHGESKILNDNQMRKIPEKLFILKNFQNPILKKHPDLFFNDGRFSGAIKSIFQVDSSTVLLANSAGVKRWGPTSVANDKDWELLDKKNNVYQFLPLNLRCNDIVYDKNNETLYIATQNALFLKPKNEPLQEILKLNKSLVVNDLEWINDELWCATQRFGILVFKDRRLIKNWNTENGLQSNFISKLKFNNNILYVQHKNGFQTFNRYSKTWGYLGKIEGIASEQIKDFALGPNNIGFLGESSITTKKMSQTTPNISKLNIGIDSVLIANKKRNFSKAPKLHHTENELEIFVHTTDIYYANEATFMYTLDGLDKNWKSILASEIDVIKYEYLPPGKYEFKSKFLLRGEEKQLESFSFLINQVFYKTWWFLSLLSVFIASIIWYLIRTKINREKNKATQKINEQRLKKELAEINLKALRSQMNPHFIFNSLNAIQSLILKKDTDASYDYIVLFSELVRNALEYSEKGIISLEQELEFIKTYLELEKLRFGDSLKYSINGNMDRDINIPSLMLQPFIENALVHGLFHKQGDKHLSIDFLINNRTVLFTITDNGIGRKKAKEIAMRQNPDHISFAFQAITNRMEILQQKSNVIADFNIEDILNNDEPAGTKVTVVLPILKRIPDQ